MAIDINNLQRREPETFAAGDTLLFERYFPEYPAGQGWYLLGVLTDLNGNEVAAGAYQSVASNDAHQVNVQAYCQGVVEGDYILAEYAVLAANNPNGLPAERHQVYRAVLTLSSDLADGLASVPQITFSQQMINQLQQTLLTLAGRINQETEMERSRFVMQQMDKVRGELAYWKEIRNNEVQVDRAKNGQPPGNVAIPLLFVGSR